MNKSNLEKCLEDYMQKYDIPSWYYGMSLYQEDAVKNLTDDVRDDFEQGSSYRVERCLNALGLTSSLTSKKIRNMVQLSRGNSIAFLFFILEGYCKTFNCDESYSIQEQILMTAIAKLDVNKTLHGLHQVLPPGNTSKKKQVKTQQLGHHKDKVKMFKINKPKPPGRPHISPYFQKLPRPKVNKLNLKSQEQTFVVPFSFWPLNAEPNYGQVATRPWFVDYKLKPVARLVKSVISEAVEKFFKKGLSMTKCNLTVASNDDPQLCKYHRFMSLEESLIKDELKVIARDRCLQMVEVFSKKQEARKQKILDLLEHDIDECAQKYTNFANVDHTDLTVLKSASCILCQAKIKTPDPTPGKKIITGDEKTCINHAEILKGYTGKRLTGGGPNIENIPINDNFDPCKPQDLETKEENHNIVTKSDLTNTNEQISNKKRISLLSPCYKVTSADPVQVKMIAKMTKKKFFNGPSSHLPHQFRYKRIFKINHQRMSDLEKTIKNNFINALDQKSQEHLNALFIEQDNSDACDGSIDICKSKITNSSLSMLESSDHTKYSHIDFKTEIMDAVVRCAKQMWKQGLTTVDEGLEIKKPSTIQYEIKYFDPNNEELMNRLLIDGMNELRKDDGYVLASLPDAYKMPILREWVKRRYGKSYTHQELLDDIKHAGEIFKTVLALQCDPPVVNLMNMTPWSSFKDFEKVMNLGQKIKENYYEKLNTQFTKQMNAAWYAMGNYLLRSGPPKRTFFAYIPSNPWSIARHRVWNGTAIRYKELRELRSQKENKAAHPN